MLCEPSFSGAVPDLCEPSLSSTVQGNTNPTEDKGSSEEELEAINQNQLLPSMQYSPISSYISRSRSNSSARKSFPLSIPKENNEKEKILPTEQYYSLLTIPKDKLCPENVRYSLPPSSEGELKRGNNDDDQIIPTEQYALSLSISKDNSYPGNVTYSLSPISQGELKRGNNDQGKILSPVQYDLSHPISKDTTYPENMRCSLPQSSEGELKRGNNDKEQILPTVQYATSLPISKDNPKPENVTYNSSPSSKGEVKKGYIDKKKMLPYVSSPSISKNKPSLKNNSGSNSKDKSSPGRFMYYISSSSEDEPIKDNLKYDVMHELNVSPDRLSINTDFGESPENQQPNEKVNLECTYNETNEMEIPAISEGETVQPKENPIFHDDKYRKMLGDKLTAKFHVTLPADSCGNMRYSFPPSSEGELKRGNNDKEQILPTVQYANTLPISKDNPKPENVTYNSSPSSEGEVKRGNIDKKKILPYVSSPSISKNKSSLKNNPGSNSKDKSSPGRFMYYISSSSEDEPIKDNLKYDVMHELNVSPDRLSINTDFDESPENEQPNEKVNLECTYNETSEMEIPPFSEDETVQPKENPMPSEDKYRKMLGDKLTAKFHVTLPADSCGLLGGQGQFIRLPHFIPVESRAYEALSFANRMTSEDFKDEQARRDFINRLQTTIRWRENQDKVKESNSRIIRWSDGSETFHVGAEVFDVIHHPLNEPNSLYARLGTCYQGQGPIKDNMTLRPKLHSNIGQSHVQGMQNRAMTKPPMRCVKDPLDVVADPGQDRERRVEEQLAKRGRGEPDRRREDQMNRKKPRIPPMHHYIADDSNAEQQLSNPKRVVKANITQGTRINRNAAIKPGEFDEQANDGDIDESNEEDENDNVMDYEEELFDKPCCTASKARKLDCDKGPKIRIKPKQLVYTHTDSD
uniref:RNA polymerase-associated protein LEO1 n=1 Tax=Drosophila rhopaloa TaxID=1041015 RepID=A0A6P4EVA1_DRORH